MNNINVFFAGLDIGSTTAKLAVLDDNLNVVYSDYRRHNTKVLEVLQELFADCDRFFNEPILLKLAVTGSAGIGISEKLGIPFVQEVVGATEVIRRKYPEVRTLIDIGGEDSKMIFFSDNKAPDIRMNGNCAGGTGAFIDQMASLLNIPMEELDKLVATAQQIYPIASRCGVFAKTDVQNLVSRKVSNADIMASVFQAVAVQAMNTLARGFDIAPKAMFIGGPFTFIPQLSVTFKRVLGLSDDQVVQPTHPELLPAMGAAIDTEVEHFHISPEELIKKIQAIDESKAVETHRLQPLFESDQFEEKWLNSRVSKKIEIVELSDYTGKTCCIGVDSGSTTTKIVALGEKQELLFSYYSPNRGNAIEAVTIGLEEFYKKIKENNSTIKIVQTAVTGYGEDLIKAAFGMDIGMVETIAHYTAAEFYFPGVSFVMDIGGQDMKAIFVQNNQVNRIELNESCSSGCGSFIENFGASLGYKVTDFAQLACDAKVPCDLGTRCTVFMNSKVKQALRENATTADIAAGLAYSVIKNSLFKVLKLKSVDELGERIVVHGGTFKNPAIHRALEVLTGRKVDICSIPELMGAVGAAITAQRLYLRNRNITQFIGLDKLETVAQYTSQPLRCKGCDNNCAITKFVFHNNEVFYSGNKCEKIFANKGNTSERGTNLYEVKNKLFFDRNVKPLIKIKKNIRIGIPRALGIYENYPFWNTLFKCCGLEVVLSPVSTMDIYLKSMGTVMSDSICFPAKLMHGHIFQLIDQKVDRIFYPMIVFEQKEFEKAQNTYNCPIVSGYGDVIRSAIDPASKYNIPIDSPALNFADDKLLRKACYEYVKQFGVSKVEFLRAFYKAKKVFADVKQRLTDEAKCVIERAEKENRSLIILAGRPYHADPLINHKTPEMLAEMGIDVIPETLLPFDALKDLQVVSQWAYPNRVYHAAQWVAERGHNVQMVQFNSFGCGPDAISVDEATDILKTVGKNHTIIKIDEITSVGSVRLRLRSMIESLQINNAKQITAPKERVTTAVFEEKDKHRTILAPYFADFYSPLIPSLLKLSGYNCINLPKPDKLSVQEGLRYANNEICYPATIVVGDIIKALKSGNYDRNEVAVGITQTGGQCRASSYISLIKKAMINAGFADVPVVSVNTDGLGKDEQPGFVIPWGKIAKTTLIAMIFADGISQMYFSTVVREKNRGDAEKLKDLYLKKIQPLFESNNAKAILKLLKEAVNDFNKIEIVEGDFPKIGIVGEIYIKYNSFGQQYIVDWLVEQGVEVVVPPIIDFFMQVFVNVDANNKANLRKVGFVDMIYDFYENYVNRIIRRSDKILSNYRFYYKNHDIRDISLKAESIVNLANQFGEGWLIPAEIAAFAEHGVNHVISVQPFGCIANQVISKGVEKRMKDLYPKLNLLFLDFDDGTSEVNIINRLHFMVKHVHQ